MPYHYVDARNDKQESTLVLVAEGDYQEELSTLVQEQYSKDFRIRFEHMLSVHLQGIWATLDTAYSIQTSRSTIATLVEAALEEGKEIMEYRRRQTPHLFEQLRGESELLYEYSEDADALLTSLFIGIDDIGEHEQLLVRAPTLNRALTTMIHEGGSRYLAGM